MRIVFLALAALALVAADDLYHVSKSPVSKLSSDNFNHQIKKLHLDHVKLVEFYAPWCGHCKALVPEWEKVAKDLKGLVKVFGVNCDENKQLCTEQGVSGFPTIKIYPPSLLGVQDFTGERNAKAIKKFATRFMNNFVKQVKSDTEPAFVNPNPQIPKVLLFSDKSDTPPLFKGLAIDFKDKIHMGMVKSDDKALCSKYRVTKFPTILVLLQDKKPMRYDGKIEYQSLFQFLNPYQETFAMKADMEDPAVSKPWLMEAVPELNSLSAEEVCYKFDGICVVAFSKPADGKPEAKVLDAITNIKAKYERQIQRGAKFSFVWLNTEVETEFAAAFSLPNVPAVAALKLGKRNRFALHDGEFEQSAIGSFLDRVLGGDAKFTPIKAMPTLTEREDPAKAKKKK
eukprot:CAMPEP_0114558710 /NCGR_PEP_ID=MMETSP0114-20121206/10531_1 /TAXON_ID=31324 /ORGANISM="Goniomonas sp, Strain m" /LENGTH=398 /DNA_ID=CAMNT_0001744127 /DNA_START=149 /DNA_END=1345 /DNA_ORIENTATION=-